MQELLRRLTEDRMAPARRDLRQGHENEPALMHSRVRQDQFVALEHEIVVSEEVDVHRPGRVGGRAHPAQPVLDRAGECEKRMRGEHGTDSAHEVQELWLTGRVNGFREVDAGELPDPDDALELANRFPELTRRVPDVRSQPEEDLCLLLVDLRARLDRRVRTGGRSAAAVWPPPIPR